MGQGRPAHDGHARRTAGSSPGCGRRCRSARGLRSAGWTVGSARFAGRAARPSSVTGPLSESLLPRRGAAGWSRSGRSSRLGGETIGPLNNESLVGNGPSIMQPIVGGARRRQALGQSGPSPLRRGAVGHRHDGRAMDRAAAPAPIRHVATSRGSRRWQTDLVRHGAVAPLPALWAGPVDPQSEIRLGQPVPYWRGGLVPGTRPCGAIVGAWECSPKRMASRGHSGSSGIQVRVVSP